MSPNERMILEALRELLREDLRMDLRTCSEKSKASWASPTKIGMACGKPHQRASSWACCHLQKLRIRGLVKRESPGVYAITEEGLASLAELELEES